MFNTSWPILIVDDEPDVLQLSKLVMEDFTVYGLPVELHTAESKAQALELIKTKLIPVLPSVPAPRVSVAFIDVVMESDTAGLELCEYIRETMGNKVVQLFIRTGQPGVAPEREVIDRYDINGYFTKAEATEDKLYSLVKSGVRQYLSFTAAMASSMIMSVAIAGSGSRQSLKGVLQALPMLRRDGHFLFVDGEPIVGGLDEAEAQELAARLGRLEGQAIMGGKFAVDSDRNMLFAVEGNAMKASIQHVIKGDWNFTPPDTVKTLLLSSWSALGTLWKQAP
ncbi:MAG: response regulator [Chloroflexi bacterium]|nr:response regulator [Chloroflexota bacterium]MCI0645443.1 response regulator [Chloroflexota bacterium]